MGTGGAPAKSAGIAGFSLHTGDASAVRAVGGGTPVSGAEARHSAPHRQGLGQRKGLLEPRPATEVGQLAGKS